MLSWDSLNKNSVEIVLELSSPTRYSTRLVKARKGSPARLYVDLENAAVVSDVRKGVTVRGSLLQAVRVRDRKQGGASLQFDFRDVRRFDARTESDPCRIVLSVAAGKTPLPARPGAKAALPLTRNGQSPPAPTRPPQGRGRSAIWPVNSASPCARYSSTRAMAAATGNQSP